MTSSPGPTPAAFSASCRATVPLVVATAYLTPTYSANFLSNSGTFPPPIPQTLLSHTSFSASNTASSLMGQEGKGFVLTGVPPVMASFPISDTS